MYTVYLLYNVCVYMKCILVCVNCHVYIGPMDGEVTTEVEGSDVEFTVTQTQGQRSEVTDRDYTLSLTTSGGVCVCVCVCVHVTSSMCVCSLLPIYSIILWYVYTHVCMCTLHSMACVCL